LTEALLAVLVMLETTLPRVSVNRKSELPLRLLESVPVPQVPLLAPYEARANVFSSRINNLRG
jgi:hypothetical protein